MQSARCSGTSVQKHFYTAPRHQPVAKVCDAERDFPPCGQPQNVPSISLLASFKVVAVECKVSVKDYSLAREGSLAISPQTGGPPVVTSDVTELKRRHREHAKCKVQGTSVQNQFLTAPRHQPVAKVCDAECDFPTCGQPQNVPSISLLASFKVVDVECKVSVKE